MAVVRYDVMLTVPHGNLANDAGARPVASFLAKLLDADSWDVLYALNRRPRADVDMNRREARGQAFRDQVADAVEAGCEILFDVHSFEPDSRRFAGKDIVLLWTPGLQDEGFYQRYAALLRENADLLGVHVKVREHRAKYDDDVCIEARELGQPADSLLLAEHNSGGPLRTYALLHAFALNRLLLERREARRAARR